MRVTSFDVFDTVLTRIWAEPRDLFVELGGRLRRAGLPAPEPEAFARERREAERAARARSPTGEIRLAAIYDELAGRLGWNAAQRAAAETTEIALEDESVRPVPGMVEEVAAARRADGRVFFLSDMYLPEVIIRGWLERAGLFLPGDRLVVSGEVGAGKGTGGMFELVRRETGADFREWVHHGDHAHADVTRPRQLGIAARERPASRLAPREAGLRGDGRFAAPWRSLLAGAARRARLACPAEGIDERQKTLWEIGATVAGPLFWGFTTWCLREARRRELDKLYFLSRDGQIFWRIAEEIQRQRGGQVGCHYLYTSRLAFAGAVDVHDPAKLRLLAAPPLAFHSVRQALANLGLGEEPELVPASLPQSEWERNLTASERQTVADWLLAPARLPRIQAALTARGERARAYLRQSGLSATSRTGLVDTGWMGTIQKNIEGLLGAPARPAGVTGFYLGVLPQAERAGAGEMLAYTNTFDRLPLRRESAHLIMLELMARGTHGPLLGFDLAADGSVAPRFGPEVAERRADAALFQEAVLAYVRCLLEVRADERAPDDGVARSVIGGYREFFQRPTAAEVRVLGRMPHADQIFEQRHTVLCPEMTLPQTVAAMGNLRRRRPGWWVQGQAALGHAPLLHSYLALKRLKWRVQTCITGQPD